MKIALVSLDQTWEDKEANIKMCSTHMEHAAKEGVDLIIFPEMTLTAFTMNTSLFAEEEGVSSTIAKFKTLANEHAIAVVFGVIIKEEKGMSSNRLYFIDDNGTVKNFYKKMHPFTFANEDRFYTPGDTLVVVDYLGMRFGLTICYDLRFCELYSSLSQRCDAIINIANWPEKRVDHWECLLRARSIENQLFIIGVNRTGTDGNGLYYKESSYIFNANGSKVATLFSEDGMHFYEIDKAFTDGFKETFNTIQDRKINSYRELVFKE